MTTLGLSPWVCMLHEHPTALLSQNDFIADVCMFVDRMLDT